MNRHGHRRFRQDCALPAHAAPLSRQSLRAPAIRDRPAMLLAQDVTKTDTTGLRASARGERYTYDYK
jgi:hypothetical protein